MTLIIVDVGRARKEQQNANILNYIHTRSENLCANLVDKVKKIQSLVSQKMNENESQGSKNFVHVAVKNDKK